MPVVGVEVEAAGVDAGGSGADGDDSPHAAVGADAWPSQRVFHSCQPQAASLPVGGNPLGWEYAVKGYPLQMKGPVLVAAAEIAGVAAAAAGVAVVVAGTCSSCD